MYILQSVEFSELIHVDRRKDRPETTYSNVELSRLFDKVIHLTRNDALVKSVCLESLTYFEGQNEGAVSNGVIVAPEIIFFFRVDISRYSINLVLKRVENKQKCIIQLSSQESYKYVQ